MSLPLTCDTPSIPLMRTRVNCAPRPRTEMLRPSPPSPRDSATPGIRCIDSARLESGNLPMSSATMLSTAAVSLRLALSALFSEALKPVTTISACWESSVRSWGTCAGAPVSSTWPTSVAPFALVTSAAGPTCACACPLVVNSGMRRLVETSKRYLLPRLRLMRLSLSGQAFFPNTLDSECAVETASIFLSGNTAQGV